MPKKGQTWKGTHSSRMGLQPWRRYVVLTHWAVKNCLLPSRLMAAYISPLDCKRGAGGQPRWVGILWAPCHSCPSDKAAASWNPLSLRATHCYLKRESSCQQEVLGCWFPGWGTWGGCHQSWKRLKGLCGSTHSVLVAVAELHWCPRSHTTHTP